MYEEVIRDICIPILNMDPLVMCVALLYTDPNKDILNTDPSLETLTDQYGSRSGSTTLQIKYGPQTTEQNTVEL